VEALIDQFAKNQQLVINAQKSYQAQMQAHASVLADATACNVEVSNLRSIVLCQFFGFWAGSLFRQEAQHHDHKSIDMESN
jgi:hypothetical protein